MSEIRLIIQYEQVSSGRIINLTGKDRRYLFKVLRLKPGDSLIVGDGKGSSFKAKVISNGQIEVLDSLARENGQANLVLCQALLKGEKNEFVIEKATELGVKSIIPFVSERCIRRETKKLERWRKIVKEASEQSRRYSVPEISEPVEFHELIEKIDNSILFWERERQSLLDKFAKLNTERDIYIVVGPEGGFSEEEVEKARSKGVLTASLGSRPLRAETASVVAVAILSFLLENCDIIKR